MGGLSGLSGLKGLSGLRSNLDPDAQKFFTDADITDATERTAVNNLAVGLKANGTWSKYHAIYPFVGGTASRHSYNLKNTAQYQITWSGTTTHDANGTTGNGSTGYGNTGYIESVAGTQNDTHLSIYSRTNNFGERTDIGSRSASESFITLRWSDGNLYTLLSATAALARANSTSQGYFLTTRLNSTTLSLYRNGSLLQSSTLATTARTTIAHFISVLNDNGTPTYYSNRNYAFATIGLGLTAAEAAADYTTIQAYQTALSRQV